jgi:hypothetical protein
LDGIELNLTHRTSGLKIKILISKEDKLPEATKAKL